VVPPRRRFASRPRQAEDRLRAARTRSEFGDVGSSERDQVRKPLCNRRADSVMNATFPLSFFMVPILPGCSMIACHKVPIQSLSLFVSITTTSRSLVPSATAAIP
jgi:hypothetical protein